MLKRLALACILGACLIAPAAYAADDPISAPAKKIPYKAAGESEIGISAIRVVLGLGLVLVMGVGIVFLLKRYMPASYGGSVVAGTRRIELIELRRLTPKLTLFLVSVDKKQLLFAYSGDQVTPMQIAHPGNEERSDRVSSDI